MKTKGCGSDRGAVWSNAMPSAMDDKCNALLAQLDKIEQEMKRIGYWSEHPPDLLAEFEAGRMRSYLDAPTFELWLQCVFLPNARAAAQARSLLRRAQRGFHV